MLPALQELLFLSSSFIAGSEMVAGTNLDRHGAIDELTGAAWSRSRCSLESTKSAWVECLGE